MKDEALKGAIGAEYQKSPWDGKGISMPPPEAPVQELTNLQRHEQNVQKFLAAQPAPVQEPVAGQPLPCPFCGHIGLDFSDGETYRWGVASCGGCGASCGDVRREYPDQGEWHTEAIAEWNRRSPAAPDLQAELDATNRQVEILSDALAESRREVAALKAVQEPVARVIDDGTPEGTTEWIPFVSRVEPLKTGDLLYTTPPAQPAPVQEPFCFVYVENGEEYFAPKGAYVPDNAQPLYTTPPAAQRQWVGLSHEEVMDSWDEIRDGDWAPDFYAVIEAKLKEKNNG
jgi:hypothetical protein